MGIGDGGNGTRTSQHDQKKEIYHTLNTWWEKNDIVWRKKSCKALHREQKRQRPRMRWMDNIEESTGIPFENLLKKTRDRKRWSIDLSTKRPTLGSRMVWRHDKTRHWKDFTWRKIASPCRFQHSLRSGVSVSRWNHPFVASDKNAQISEHIYDYICICVLARPSDNFCLA